MGGSGGGGSSSGTIDYPSYMKTTHEAWLSKMSTLITSVTTGASPFATATAYDPEEDVTAMLAAACNFETAIDNLDSVADFASSIANAILRVDAMINTPAWVDPTPASEAEISADVAAYTNIQNDILENETLPRFKAGMRDINAVQSTAFTLGQAYLESANLRDIAKYQGDLRIKAFLSKDELLAKSAIAENEFNLRLELDRRKNILSTTDVLMRHILTKADYQRAVVHYLVEARRIQIVAYKEESDANLLLDEKDAKWDLEAYQYGANMLSAISGGTVAPSTAKQSATSSAIGGALTGAAIGTQIMPGWGTAIGAVVGAAAGLLSSN